MDNAKQQSTNYDEFRTLNANRNVSENHVKQIKAAIETVGNLTEVVPIIVNENKEIIDGQHRFEACKELGLPIFYTDRKSVV